MKNQSFLVISVVLTVFALAANPVACAQQQLSLTETECRNFPEYPPEKSLPAGLARQLYRKASSKFFYTLNTWKPCDFYYSDLAASLGLRQQIELADAKTQLKATNEQLLNDFYIDGYRWFEPQELSPEDRRDKRWQIRYYPGVRFTHNQLLELWYEVVSGDNNVVTGTINNRSFLFTEDNNTKNSRRSAEQSLLDALDCARDLGVPRDIIACLLNLGTFEYVGKNFSQADQYFREALELARSTSTVDSPALAPLLDFEALSARSMNDFTRAEKLYVEALQLRSLVGGYFKAQVAHSLMNLACLYLDWSYAVENPQLTSKYQARSQELQKRVDEIMNPTSNADLYEKLTTEAVRLHIQAHDDQANGWKYNAQARGLLNRAESLKSSLVLVNSKDRSDVLPNMLDLSHCLPRQTPLSAKSGTDKLTAMVSFAKSITKKCERKTTPPPPPPEEVGLATILGNWAIPTDVVNKSVKKTMHRQETVLEGRVDVEETREEKVSPVENVTIYLCKYPENPNTILSQIQRYGAEKGLAWMGLGQFGTTHGWPANHLQAEQLKNVIDASARSIAKRVTTTDKHGDYKFEGVPKGDYLLYGSVCTQKHCLVWLIPPDRIIVRRVNQFRFDFAERTGIKIWESGHPAAPPTPTEYFSGTSAQTKQTENGKK